MSTIEPYQTKTGRRYRVRYRRPDGRQTDKRGFTRKIDAEAWLASQVTAMRAGEWVDPADGRITVRELGESWLAGRTDIKPSYRHSLETAWRVHVEPRWGDHPVASVRADEVQAWISSIERSATVVRRAHGVLSGILADAVRSRRIATNPCGGIRLPRKVARENRYLTWPQLLALAEASKDHRTLVLVLGLTGLRWGEATALRVRDWNPLRRRLHVNQNAVKVGSKIIVGTPKSHRTRTVSVPSLLVDQISSRCEGRGPDDLLFPGRSGGFLPYPANERRTWWAAATMAVGLEGLRRHELRHTAASLAVASGASVKAVQRMLGHSSAAMTLDVYSDLFDHELDEVAARMDVLIAGEDVGKVWARPSADAAEGTKNPR